MLPDELASVDLAALQTLVAVQDRASFSDASQLLGVNQSTISYAIKRLRKAFNDPLFVRQGNSIVATDKGEQLAQQARGILEQMAALSSPSGFDPATAEGSVTVSCNHHERMFLIPDFLRRAQKEAPQATIHIFESAVDGKQQLKENTCDIVLGPVSILGDIYYRRKMFSDHYACVMDPAHELTRGALTLERYCASRHVAVTHNGRWEALYFAALLARGIELEPDVTVSSHDILERLIPASELVATIPYRLARRLSDRLALRPFPMDVFIQVDMYWTERTHHSGLHRWARQILAEVAEENLGDGDPPTARRDDRLTGGQ
ncbi:LysR family transcriptional regulator [Mesorhizobium prunaredense]|uniref:LysR family transcriptional regulator n=1 Tax=Mesorhizobium prunaredense TaxID=1631249 RepID=A0A1R3VEV3_9HYPH|nr:LysR family transcriptional regulator [Mesorhizobium prunaredense]SIT56931.1 LysR family transcriptional regulator [Mesorhizobium prunaredense]